MKLSHSWISLAITYLSAFFPYSCSIWWRWQCQLVPQKTRWQSTRIRSCLFLQDVKKIVPLTCSLYSAVWQSLLILPTFPQDSVCFFLPIWFSVSIIRTTALALMQFCASLTESTQYWAISIKNRVLVSERGAIQSCSSESPLASCQQPMGCACSASGDRGHICHGGYRLQLAKFVLYLRLWRITGCQASSLSGTISTPDREMGSEQEGRATFSWDCIHCYKRNMERSS